MMSSDQQEPRYCEILLSAWLLAKENVWNAATDRYKKQISRTRFWVASKVP